MPETRKKLRHSHDKANGKEALHRVACVGSRKPSGVSRKRAVDKESNEITAIPLLLQKLTLSGCIITIDAMGTQKKFTKQIVDDDGDFVIALKKNQGTLRSRVEQTFTRALEGSSQEIQVYFYPHNGERAWPYRDPTTLDD